MHFSDQMTHWKYEVPSVMDSTYTVTENSLDDMRNFFSRPVKIATYTWAVNQVLFETFNPWNLFFTNPRVINRICNYANMRCKLHVRFILNGSGFHYGRALASYRPLHKIDNITRERAFFSQDLIAASQRPKIFLDPTKSKGGDMILPFFWMDNTLKVTASEWDEMGEITIHGMNILKHANGSTDAVNVSVFAWAEDMVLSTPTSAEPGTLVAQSGDEYDKTKLSGMANSVAQASNMLSSIPMIAPYARATEMISTKVGNVAKAFGYCKPVQTNDETLFVRRTMGNTVNVCGKDTSIKMTLDPKQELTIDTRTMGLAGTDEMTILSVAQHESYFTTFTWPMTSVSESFLFTTKVTPMIYDTLNVNGHVEYHMTAPCYATLPFNFWRGSLKFRFQIVASAYHKGRLKVVYDPVVAQSNEYNTNFVHMVDIANQRDFTIDVGWGQPMSYCKNRVQPLDEEVFRSTSNFGTLASTNVDYNGVLSVYCVNELTAPNSTVNNDISVNVFVSVGDDFEVVDLNHTSISDLSLFPDKRNPGVPPLTQQSGTEGVTSDSVDLTQPDGDRCLDENMPIMDKALGRLAPSLSTSDNTQLVYFGDPVSSFRTLLKRYNFHSVIAPDRTVANLNVTVVLIDNFPFHRGYANDGLYNTISPTDPTPYNYCLNTLLTYLAPAYGAYRGGIRRKVVYTGQGNNNNMIHVSRRTAGFDGPNKQSITLDAVNTASPHVRATQLLSATPSGMNGVISANITNQTALEYEMPFYDRHRFYCPKRVNNKTATDNKGMFNLHRVAAQFSTVGAPNALLVYCATGEDFTLAFYLGPPVFFRYTDPLPNTNTPSAQ